MASVSICLSASLSASFEPDGEYNGSVRRVWGKGRKEGVNAYGGRKPRRLWTTDVSGSGGLAAARRVDADGCLASRCVGRAVHIKSSSQACLHQQSACSRTGRRRAFAMMHLPSSFHVFGASFIKDFKFGNLNCLASLDPVGPYSIYS